MKRSIVNLSGLLFSAVLAAASAAAADWPQWQGPDRNAVSKESGLLQEWPEGGPTLSWRVSGLGGGDSAPSIAAGRIFGMSNRGEDEVVWALSEKDGSEIWVTRLGPAHRQAMRQSQEGPGCTPTVDGERLYVLGLSGTLACMNVSDGKILWQRSLTSDFGGRIPTWSYRESPLIDGDKLICTPGGEQVTMAALNKLTGATVWTNHVPDPPGGGSRGRFGNSGAAYASAITVEFGGKRQYVQLLASTLAGVAADDGKLLWRYDRPANTHKINCSTPLYHDGHVFASSAYGAGGGLVKLGSDNEGGIKADEVWFSKNLENHHGGVVLVDGCLYGANGGNGGGYLVCLDFKTGDVVWNERDADKRRVRKGSLAVADGRIYYRAEEGDLILIEPSRTEYLERGRFMQPDRSRQPAWAHPVIANGKLYVRDQNVLFCYNVRK